MSERLSAGFIFAAWLFSLLVVLVLILAGPVSADPATEATAQAIYGLAEMAYQEGHEVKHILADSNLAEVAHLILFCAGVTAGAACAE
jgi:hypothetical protein